MDVKRTPSWEVRLVAGWCEDEADAIARKVLRLRTAYNKNEKLAKSANAYANMLEACAAGLLKLRRELLDGERE